MGGYPRHIHFTEFLLMWISNFATTAMMCPILKVVLDSLENQGLSIYEEGEPEAPRDGNERRPSLSIAIYLIICYSSSIVKEASDQKGDNEDERKETNTTNLKF